MTDLTLIPIKDLLKEIDNRCACLVLAYETFKDVGKEAQYYYGKGKWSRAIYISTVLQNDVLNNWNGEMIKLQKMTEEENEADADEQTRR